MKVTRRHLLGALCAMPIAAAAALAQSNPTDQILAQLRGQGYQVQEMTRTLLGRVRIIATRGGEQRELVFNPRNGLILRDYSVRATGAIGGAGGGAGQSSGGGSGAAEDFDDDDDDDDDDDEEDDDDD